MNQRNHDRYRRYGADFDTEVVRLPMAGRVLIEMPLDGSRGFAGVGGFSPRFQSGSALRGGAKLRMNPREAALGERGG